MPSTALRSSSVGIWKICNSIMPIIAPTPDGRIPPIHPGEFLREDFMKPLHLSAKSLAAALHVSIRRVADIANERRVLDAEMALRLARYFGMSAQFWMNVQMKYELEVAQDTLASRVRREIRPAPRDRKTGELKAVPTMRAGSRNAGPSTRSREKIGANSLRMTS